MRCLVVYVFQNRYGNGIGSSDCYFRSNPPTIKDIADAQKEIQDREEMESVTIVNWIPLSEDEEDKTKD